MIVIGNFCPHGLLSFESRCAIETAVPSVSLCGGEDSSITPSPHLPLGQRAIPVAGSKVGRRVFRHNVTAHYTFLQLSQHWSKKFLRSNKNPGASPIAAP
jgi:hypothetical protein